MTIEAAVSLETRRLLSRATSLLVRFIAHQGGSRSRQGSPSLNVVFAWWDDNRSRRALSALQSKVAQLIAHGCEVRLCIVDNAGTATVVGESPMVTVIRGNNRDREFGAWDLGWRALPPSELWLFVNDRFLSTSYDYLGGLSVDTLRFAGRQPSLIGKVDYYPDAVWWRGDDVSTWVRTTFFLGSADVLRAVEGPLQVTEANFTDAIPESFTGLDALMGQSELEPRHVRYLVAFITGALDAGLASQWYRPTGYASEKWPEFREKARMILNEQALSARARRVGATLVDLRVAQLLGALGPTSCWTQRAVAAFAADPARATTEWAAVRPRLRLALQARR